MGFAGIHSPPRCLQPFLDTTPGSPLQRYPSPSCASLPTWRHSACAHWSTVHKTQISPQSSEMRHQPTEAYIDLSQWLLHPALPQRPKTIDLEKYHQIIMWHDSIIDGFAIIRPVRWPSNLRFAAPYWLQPDRIPDVLDLMVLFMALCITSLVQCLCPNLGCE
jgi:hypothetical protein